MYLINSNLHEVNVFLLTNTTIELYSFCYKYTFLMKVGDFSAFIKSGGTLLLKTIVSYDHEMFHLFVIVSSLFDTELLSNPL